jgi:hypothetical protein
MKFLGLGLLLVLACGPARDAAPRISPEHVSPESTVHAYWLHMLQQEYDAALRCFTDYHPAGVPAMQPLPPVVELRCRDFVRRETRPGRVDLAYRVEYRTAMGDSLASFATGDRLSWTNGGWKIARPLLFAAATP